MQTTNEEIHEIIEQQLNAKPRISTDEKGRTIFKISTSHLVSHEIVALAGLRKLYSVSLEIRRSGTGLVIIIEH